MNIYSILSAATDELSDIEPDTFSIWLLAIAAAVLLIFGIRTLITIKNGEDAKNTGTTPSVAESTITSQDMVIGSDANDLEIAAVIAAAIAAASADAGDSDNLAFRVVSFRRTGKKPLHF